MWYFTWILGIGFAVLLAIVNAIWLEYEEGRLESFSKKRVLSDSDTLPSDTLPKDDLTSS